MSKPTKYTYTNDLHKLAQLKNHSGTFTPKSAYKFRIPVYRGNFPYHQRSNYSFNNASRLTPEKPKLSMLDHLFKLQAAPWVDECVLCYIQIIESEHLSNFFFVSRFDHLLEKSQEYTTIDDSVVLFCYKIIFKFENFDESLAS